MKKEMKKQEVVLNRASTVFLRLAIFGIGAIVLALCVFVLPALWVAVPTMLKGRPGEYPVMAYAFYGILIDFCVAAVPFYVALYQSLKLLGYIDKGKAFSKLSVKALKVIAYCGVAISLIFAASLPFFYVWADRADAPGLIIVGMILSCAAFTVTVFAALMQRLLKQAIEMKNENELTV